MRLGWVHFTCRSRGYGWVPFARRLPAGPATGRASHPALAGGGLAGPAPAGAPRAPRAGFRGRIGILPAAGGGADIRPGGADPGPAREADARPSVGHGRP